MIDERSKKNRKFQTIKIADSLRNINKKFIQRYGKLDYTIYAKWGEIVGPFFVKHSEPQNITSIPISKNELGESIYERYLHVNVTPAAAIEFQHFQNKIIEKINSYFGFKIIRGIKIHQKLTKKEKNYFEKKIKSTKKDNNKIQKIKDTTPKISDKELEKSIINLGLSIEDDNQ